MSAQIVAYGRIGRDPRDIPTRTGTAMAAVSLAVEVPCRNEGDDGATLWLDVLGFGSVATEPMRHAKGDSVSVSGRLALNRYQANDGSERESWQCIADSVISARTVRPKGGRRKGDGAGETRSGGGGRGGATHDQRTVWPASGPNGPRDPDPPPRSDADPVPFDDDLPF